ncbi:hypothetical protein [Mucilaginibacter pedocola]|uniref:Bacteriocin n=1 Tax=Mucilaginibacter pedocola TaxID=1792845 RepID=A0A1S9PDV1_9SPHI|nr:hypothetical protein [Mucilaginibacter pedocola]OOQ58758.1 hypothetical protein BC343_08880 [Mucilaginibacter pedocola]
MKSPQELSKEELEQTNGGSDSASSTNSGLLGNIGIGNLASGGTASQDGDEASASHFSLGNGITGDLGGILSGKSQNS